MKELSIAATVENLDEVLDFVKEELELAGCEQKLQMQIAIAVEEVFVNIAHYAYQPEIGPAVIRVSSTESEITIEFEDKGTPYNPLLRDDPDITQSLEDRKIGGLGIYMVKKIMDSIEYQHIDNKNILTIKKIIVA